jgi:arylsulfatase A-like enzyme
MSLVLVLGLAGCGPDEQSPRSGASSPAPSPAVAASTAVARPTAGERTNIVLVLVDDLAMNLVRYMPQVRKLAAQGTSFSDYTVTDSLCCPSRASLLTGRYPHNTGVFTNTGPDGGFATFRRLGNEKSTFATDLRAAGYRTAFLGKYINGYFPATRHVPPGWTTWAAGGNAYTHYNYDLLEDDRIKHYGAEPADYLTDVLSRKATSFIRASAAAGRPFLVEVSTYAPHLPYTPAPRDAEAFKKVKAPRGPSFGRQPTGATPWLARHQPLTGPEIRQIDQDFRERVRAVQAVDRMVGSVRATLTRAGVADRTVVVFTSDNGLHMGEHGLNPGKQTAFDTDINVPLIAAGPGIVPGATVRVPAENIDLRPSFAELAGVGTPADVDGSSLVPLWRGETPAWRDVALVEHHGPSTDPADPDIQPWRNANPPDYRAIRAPAFTYVEYGNGAREYYDNLADPHQLHNVAATLSADRLARLHRTLVDLSACRGEQACRAAGRYAAFTPSR